MTRYQGTILGMNFDIELKDEEELIELLYQKLRKYQFTDILIKVLDRLLNDTDTIKEVKVAKVG